MNKIEVCSQQILSFDADYQLTKKIYQQVLNEDWRNNGKNNYRSVNSFLHKKDEYKQLIQWFEQCLLYVKDYHHYAINGKFGITQCWANKTIKNGFFHCHVHSNSLLSGVFYLTKSAPTYFNTHSVWDLPLLQRNASRQPVKGIVQSSPGKLLIFPSSLYHGVDLIDDDKDRYSMSFNTFIQGSIGDEIDLDLVRLDVVDT